jgi:CubicO group peptidase (beta-lactamase class C family)
MILFNPFIWPIFLVGLSMLITYLTGLDLPGKLRRSRRIGPAGEGDSKAPAIVTAKLPVSVRIVRNGGIFWFCAGVASLGYALTPEPWIRPGAWINTFLGLYLVVVGTKLFRSTFPRRVVRIRPSGEGVQLPQIVTQLADRACASGHVGIVVGAIAGKEEFLRGFGALRVGGTQPPNAETVFEIGSISKVFTGILLARAIETGKLDLDDRIANLLPEGWTLPEPARAITLRHCTTHTSGLPRLPTNLLSFADALRLAYLGNDPYRDYTEEKFRQALALVKLNHEPGTRYEYSNFGAGLLGFVLAHHNASDYESLVTDSICQPLGMRDTVISADERTCNRLPSIYRLILKLGPVSFGLKSDEWRFPNHLAGAGAIRSTGRDMMTFLKANMGLVSTPIDAAIRRSHRELFRDTAGLTIGMNWIRSFDDELAQNIIWHNGGTGGFRTYLGFMEDRQIGVFVLGNTANSVDALAVEILKSLVREHATEAENRLQTMAVPKSLLG